MKIYMVTSGCYSNYSIRGAFSSEENAEAAIRRAKGADQYWAQESGIEEYEVDELLAAEPVKSWQVAIRLEDGALVGWYLTPIRETPLTSWEKPFRTDTSPEIVTFDGKQRKRVRSTVSFEHACKLAVEWRQGWLREKSGPFSTPPEARQHPQPTENQFGDTRANPEDCPPRPASHRL